MPDLIHDPSALHDLAASADEPARSWAAALAWTWDPQHATRWPSAPRPVETWGPALLRNLELRGLEQALEGPIDRGLAAMLEGAPRSGADLRPHLDAIEAAFDRATPDARPALALALALHGRCLGEHLKAAAAEATRAELALLALLHAHAQGADLEVAVSILEPLDHADRMAVLIGLGLPRFLQLRRELEHAAADGALRAGGTPPSPPRRTGARRHRVRAWIDQLLQGRQEALAWGLRGVARTELSGHAAALLVGSAAWLGAFEPSDDPVQDVLARNGACVPSVLRAARRGSTLSDHDVKHALDSADSDVLYLLFDDPPASALHAALVRDRPDLGVAFLPRSAPALPEFLLDPETRTTALEVAAWCPTLPVLETLLALPVPFGRRARRALCMALASMGDAVATRHLQAVLDSDADLDADAYLAIPRALLG